MRPIFTARISTMIAGLVRAYVPSGQYAGSWECDRCGSNYHGVITAGTSGSTFEIECHAPNLLRSRLCADLTADGKLSISCACVQSESTKSDPGSGDDAGTFSIPANYRDGIGTLGDAVTCSRCRLNRARFVSVLINSQNVKPKYPFLCTQCLALMSKYEG